MNYMEYLVTCPLDEQQMSSLLYERDDLSAIDFSLLMKTIKAFHSVEISKPCIKNRAPQSQASHQKDGY